MPGYLVAQISVHDEAAYAEYRARVPEVIAAFGGRFLVRGGAPETMEGSAPSRRMVVVEFPSIEAARAFYASAGYAPLLGRRLACSSGDVVLVDGVAPV